MSLSITDRLQETRTYSLPSSSIVQRTVRPYVPATWKFQFLGRQRMPPRQDSSVLWRKDPGPHPTGSGRMVPAKNGWPSQRGLDRTHV